MDTPPVFQPVKVSWKGADYTIAPNRLMRCIAMIEEIVTLPFLSKCWVSGELPYAKLAMALGAVLRYAGANVTDEEVYAEMFKGPERRMLAAATLQTLMVMMFPPEHLRELQEASKKAQAGAGTSETQH